MHDDGTAGELLAEVERAMARLFASGDLAALEQTFQRVVARIDPRLFVLTSPATQQRVLAANQQVRNLYWEAILRVDAQPESESTRAPTRRIRRAP